MSGDSKEPYNTSNIMLLRLLLVGVAVPGGHSSVVIQYVVIPVSEPGGALPTIKQACRYRPRRRLRLRLQWSYLFLPLVVSVHPMQDHRDLQLDRHYLAIDGLIGFQRRSKDVRNSSSNPRPPAFVEIHCHQMSEAPKVSHAILGKLKSGRHPQERRGVSIMRFSSDADSRQNHVSSAWTVEVVKTSCQYWDSESRAGGRSYAVACNRMRYAA